jgi:aminopeptidase-like protein
MAVTLDFNPAARGERMMRLLTEIAPLPRLINSPGLDRAFALLQAELPELTVSDYAAGMECEDWIVPRSWACRHGVMKDRAGKTIASTEECPLFVAPYSQPVEGWFSKQEIARHIRTRPDRPDAFFLEHRYAYDYRLKDWGITLPHSRWSSLPEGDYFVRIDIESGSGSMKVGEWFLPGRRPETLCLNAHIDELCNDDLSGCVVGIELMHGLSRLPQRQYSYLLVLSPELLGTLFYVGTHAERMRQTIGMLNLETLGAGDELCLKRTLEGNHRLDSFLRQAARQAGVSCRELGFFQGYGNDERVFAWPTLALPGVALQRYPFAQYHTSDDTPAIVRADYLLEALRVAEEFINLLDRDYVPALTQRLPPWLTRRGLYFDSKLDTERFQRFNNLVLFNLNGKRSVLELAELAGLEFAEALAYLDRFAEQGLVGKNDVSWPTPEGVQADV